MVVLCFIARYFNDPVCVCVCGGGVGGGGGGEGGSCVVAISFKRFLYTCNTRGIRITGNY